MSVMLCTVLTFILKKLLTSYLMPESTFRILEPLPSEDIALDRSTSNKVSFESVLPS